MRSEKREEKWYINHEKERSRDSYQLNSEIRPACILHLQPGLSETGLAPLLPEP